jgi:ferredoxin--NADP+ reductase
MLNATVVEKIVITSELIRLIIKPDAPFKEFLPGQYVAIGLPGSAPRPEGYPPEKEPQDPDKIIKRAYSIGSSPLERDVLEFYIAIVPDGALTSRLVLVEKGDRVFAAPKITGTFTLDSVPADHNLYLVSTGTGLAPYISMLRTPSTWTAGRKIAVLHGVRYPKDLGYRAELEQYQAEHPGVFSYHPVVSRDDGTPWHGTKGHVQKLFEDGTLTLDTERDHIFVCGNPAMIQSIEHLVAPRGYTEHTRKAPGKLHLEKYW